MDAVLQQLGDAVSTPLPSSPIATRSERKRQVNPRKVYLADHGLAAAFQSTPTADRGHHFDNIVACELKRWCRDLSYVKTDSGLEVDFLVTAGDGSPQLIQVAADVRDAATFEREIRSLQDAATAHPRARKLLIVDRPIPRAVEVPTGIELVKLCRLLLEPSIG